jgi:hypothetical protein
MIRLDNGRTGGAWFTVNNKSYDLACTEEHGRGRGRLHHVTYATDQREDILRAADIFLQNGVHIETGPTSTRSRAPSSSTSGSPPATASSSPTPAPASSSPPTGSPWSGPRPSAGRARPGG